MGETIGKIALAACQVIMIQVLLSAGAVTGEEDHDVLYQVSTIDALLESVYDGVMNMSGLLEHGDFGIGCFEGIDGEMIGVDGEFYQALADGSVRLVSDNQTTPFATVTFFEPDLNLTVEGDNLTLLESSIEAQIPSDNMFYAIRIDGVFPYVKARAIPKQEKPYPRLAEASANQSVFELYNVSGSIVGFYSPPFSKGVNVPGYHLHLISDDRKAGGHILDLRLNQTTASLDVTPEFFMLLPTEGAFAGANLTKDLSAELEQVEK
ncbi:MAG: Alpha-acetolactate decarboxylase [Methanosaeta sp. PtaU1.Bin028]|nr:MAG: Alpha-acetolactate decarboxylase [Methanosaeta sp. PtaU1.Bin028]